MLKICLDSGHYGKYNQSTSNKAYYESEVMWKLVEYLRDELLTYQDVEVITTRKNQKKDLALFNRGQTSKGCDLFISEHSNAAVKKNGSIDPSVDYVVVYRGYLNKNNADELGLRLAKSISKTMGTKQDPRTNSKKSEKGDWEYYGVLRGADSVGCPRYYIVENSFHTNPRATEWLLQDDNLKKLAEAQAKTIAEYYGVSKIKRVPTKTITPESPPEDIRWAQERYNVVLPQIYPEIKGIIPMEVTGIFGPELRIATTLYWFALGWGNHMKHDGKGIGIASIEALAVGRIE